MMPFACSIWATLGRGRGAARAAAVRHDDHIGVLRHGEQRRVILWPAGVIDLKQPVFVGRAVRVHVADPLRPEPEQPGHLAGLGDSGVRGFQVSDAGVHHHPENRGQTRISWLAQLIAITAAIREAGGDDTILGPAHAGLAARVVGFLIDPTSSTSFMLFIMLPISALIRTASCIRPRANAIPPLASP